MNGIQIFDVLWLCSLLVLLFLIWRSSEKRSQHALMLETTLVDVATKNAESVRQAIASTQEVIGLLKTLSATKEIRED